MRLPYAVPTSQSASGKRWELFRRLGILQPYDVRTIAGERRRIGFVVCIFLGWEDHRERGAASRRRFHRGHQLTRGFVDAYARLFCALKGGKERAGLIGDTAVLIARVRRLQARIHRGSCR